MTPIPKFKKNDTDFYRRGGLIASFICIFGLPFLLFKQLLTFFDLFFAQSQIPAQHFGLLLEFGVLFFIVNHGKSPFCQGLQNPARLTSKKNSIGGFFACTKGIILIYLSLSPL